MEFNLWFVIIGLLLISVALTYSSIRPLPISTEMLYLLVGIGLGPVGLGLIRLDIIKDAELLERLTEIVVLVSLFSAGLKLRTPLSDGRWYLPVRLASISMILTIGLVALVGVFGLGLSWGAAILLGAILAPTDPVLASDVQLRDPLDRDRLRFSLTGEAGLNDGTAFPFVMLGLGFLGLHEMGEGLWRWWAVDVLWSVIGGLAVGAVFGTLIGRLMLFMRRRQQETLGLDDFLTLGLIALSFGTAMMLHTYGFLAVLAAGVALRRIERHAEGINVPHEMEMAKEEGQHADPSTNSAIKPEDVPAFMAQAVMGFSEQLERIGTIGIVVLLGGMLTPDYFSIHTLWLIPLLFVLLRPIAVFSGLGGSATSSRQRNLIAWFGVRGIGSLYYLTYAIAHDIAPDLARQLSALVVPVVVTSIFVHGISVTPLMQRYGRKQEADSMTG